MVTLPGLNMNPRYFDSPLSLNCSVSCAEGRAKTDICSFMTIRLPASIGTIVSECNPTTPVAVSIPAAGIRNLQSGLFAPMIGNV